MVDQQFILLGVESLSTTEVHLLGGPFGLTDAEDRAQEFIEAGEDNVPDCEWIAIVPIQQFWNVTELRAESDEEEDE